jgi:hypothetical protein
MPLRERQKSRRGIDTTTYNIDTRTLSTQCSALDSAGNCWFVKEGKARITMNDSDKGMRSKSSNSSCMHDWSMPQGEKSRVKGSIQPQEIETRT